ncbi:flavodoxin family protein [Methylocystis heyeri]|uniref:Flavodoxin family protein n=1 Tax=Methylocystis heyeri TaxID=391905 RepID=A0A6B8KDB7_9HYPH|nr:NAD(P)H-dependent oxidoreductase [Methylocystis heyeri]QGM44423.1 flavodoxin family protein [Methylocystis heyeri]
MADPTKAASPKKLLIVAHAPSPNTLRLRDALAAGARELQIEGLEVQALGPFQTHPENVVAADAIILLTPENLGYMSGALKDFFDRIYYPCLERTQGLPYALCVRAGSDGGGTRRAVETIATGLRWRKMQEPLICRGEWRDGFLADCREMAMRAAAGLDAGIF